MQVKHTTDMVNGYMKYEDSQFDQQRSQLQ